MATGKGKAEESATAEGEVPAGLEPLLRELAERLASSGRAETIFGTAVERDGVTVIPVGKLKWGIGGGGGGLRRLGLGEGFGAGGGVTVEPVGFIEIGRGEARFRPIRDGRVFLGLAVAAGVLLLFGVGRLFRS
jgi:uncharacterized spore protein YtfJ